MRLESVYYFYTEGKITRDHGRLVRLPKYNIYPVYHPAAALRNTSFAKALLSDFMEIPKVLKDARSLDSSKLEKEKNDNPLGL